MRPGAFAKLLLIGVAALQCACAGLFGVPEPIRIGNWADLDERLLALAPGRTTLREAEQAMRRAGLTGIRSDTYVDDGPRMVGALSADFQTRVYVFENDRYQRSLSVRSGSVLPFGYSMRIARAGEDLFILALYRDSLFAAGASSAKGPRVALFVDEERGFEFVKSVALDEIASANGGMTSPIFVGHDLGEGVMFLARDRDGGLWNTAYVVSLRGRELELKPLPMQEAARCSCVEKYVYAAGSEASEQD